MNDTEIKTYSDEDTEQIITNRHTGTWKIGATDIYNSHLEFHYYNGIKPHWFHRLMARILLGWKWEDRK
jgi:hypothetical protein